MKRLQKTQSVTSEPTKKLEDCYHGLLPREDMKYLLRNEGDFVVRLSGAGKDQKKVISVLWSKRLQHFIIKDTGGPSAKKEYFVEKKKFNGITELLKWHWALREPVSEASGALLVTPVPKQQWEIDHSHIQKGKLLGQGKDVRLGEFGEVYQGLLKQGHEKAMNVAIKICKVKKADITDKNQQKFFDDRQKFLREARIMRLYKHPNLVRLIGVAAKEEPLMLIMEFVAGGPLQLHLRQHVPLPTADIHSFSLDAAKGMEYLETNGCIHRDLAGRNCLLTKKKQLKITDFGLAATQSFYNKSTRRVPIRWLAPETLRNGYYTKETDRWSYGILLWEICSAGDEPYPRLKNDQIQRKVGQERFTMTTPPSAPNYIALLMQRCWNQTPQQRPSFTQIRMQLEKGPPPTSRATKH